MVTDKSKEAIMRGMLLIDHFFFFFFLFALFSSLTPNVRAEGGRWKPTDLRQRDANWLLDRLRQAGQGRGPHSQAELWQLGKCVKVIQMRCRAGRCNYAKVKKQAWPSVKCMTCWQKISFYSGTKYVLNTANAAPWVFNSRMVNSVFILSSVSRRWSSFLIILFLGRCKHIPVSETRLNPYHCF